MTGSHEVRGSIPLGSTNSINKLGPPNRWPKSFKTRFDRNADSNPLGLGDIWLGYKSVHRLGSIPQHLRNYVRVGIHCEASVAMNKNLHHDSCGNIFGEQKCRA